ncbi:MAG: hypothetical protein LC723_03435, partial [Actinobacteria bacterium]|nr:hypothetical protein [Actinomycetota bacterium]
MQATPFMRVSTRPRWIKRLTSAVPHGSSLPDDVWKRRHSAITWILWAHTVGILVFGVARGYSVLHSGMEAAIVASAAVVARVPRLSPRLRMVVASLGLLTASAILVHLSGGLIEMHFHFFVMVALVALYQDWLPFATAFGYVLIHHG